MPKGFKHGYSKTREHKTWLAMRYRCLNPNAHQAPYYKGITFCIRWNTFINFLEDMGTQPKGTTLDRIDSTKGYCKENCRWATWKEQQNNRKSNHLVTYHGVTKNITQWAEQVGIPFRTLEMRILRGWDLERVFTQKIKKRTCNT